MSAPRQSGTESVRLERHGRVVESGGKAVVRFARDCAMVGAEGDAVCPCMMFRRERDIPVAWLDGARTLAAGDAVTLTVPVTGLNRVAWLLFAAPLAALLIGAWLGGLAGESLGPGASDIASGVVGLGCLALASIAVAVNGGAMIGMLQLTARCRRMDS